MVKTQPGDIQDITTDELGNVYYTGTDEDEVPTVYKYDGQFYEPLYANTYRNGGLRGIDYADGTLWVLANRLNPDWPDEGESYILHFLVRIELGEASDEIYIPDEIEEQDLYGISAVNKNNVWFQAGHLNSSLIEYDTGSWNEHSFDSGVSGFLFDTDTSTTYVWGNNGSDTPPSLWISLDGGDTWIEETIATNDDPIVEITGIGWGGAVRNGELILSAFIMHGGVEYLDGLVRREKGVDESFHYFPELWIPFGPLFNGGGHVVFEEVNGTGYYYSNTSAVYFDGKDWLKERPEDGYSDIVVGQDRFWGIIKEGSESYLAYRLFEN